MKPQLHFSATPLDAVEVIDFSKVPTARLQTLLNVGGVVYPNLQRSSNWSNFEKHTKQFIYRFDQSPRGDFIVDQNGGFESRRELIYGETGAILCLETLIHEIFGTFESHGRFLNVMLKEPKRCILGVFLEGFDGVSVDWACFATKSNPTVYKLFTSFEGSSFESSRQGVMLPYNSKEELCEGITEIISQLIRRIFGLRKDPVSGVVSKIKLNISDGSIRKVVENIFHTHASQV